MYCVWIYQGLPGKLQNSSEYIFFIFALVVWNWFILCVAIITCAKVTYVKTETILRCL